MAQATEKITYTATAEQVQRMHSAFDAALQEAESLLGKTYPMIINGQERTADKTFSAVSPIDHRKVLGHFPLGSTADVDDAVAAAKAAYPTWSSRPWAERVAIMRRAAELIRERKFLLSALLIIECGKNRAEAIGEVEEGADLIDEYAGQMEANDGFVRPMGSLDPREANTSILRPFGVWAVLAPFNFPMRCLQACRPERWSRGTRSSSSRLRRLRLLDTNWRAAMWMLAFRPGCSTS